MDRVRIPFPIAVAAAVGLLVVAFSVDATGTASGPVRVSLAQTQPAPIAGRAWTARLVVRPALFKGAIRVSATGATRIAARATGGHGSYRAQLRFPSAGRWTLTAHAGGSTSKLGSVQVREAARTPLTFVWPTSVDVEPDGRVLIVENGIPRVLRVDPATGSVTTIASTIPKAYAVARAPSGSLYVSGAHGLFRIDDASTPTAVAEVATGIGPIAVAANGDVYFVADARVFELPHGAGPPVRIGDATLSAPHGLAVAADGALLVSDTGNNRVLRIDPASGAATTLAAVGSPRGLDVAADGMIYVVDSTAKRVVHLSPIGTTLGFHGPAFTDPYDVAFAPDGALYVVDTAESGHVRRIARDGTVTTLSR
jgi:streptogramin lyase